MPPFMQPITGAPYCAEQHAQSFRTYADGTRVPGGMEGVIQVCRDSKGRTYEERRTIPSQRNPDRPPVFILNVRDPITGFQYIVDPTNHVAHRFPLKVEGEPPPANGRSASTPQAAQSNSSPPDPKRPIISTISLGTQVFEGEPANGRRITITYPTGSRGNDAPFSEVHEIWTSPYLKVPILQKNSDPISHDSVVSLTRITRIEPDPNLFLIPSDYKIIDEVGPFDITWYFN
jgi:hypothetical protein